MSEKPKSDHKGWCVSCERSTNSLHKCDKCGNYVMIPFDARTDAANEIRSTKNAIKAKYIPIITNKENLKKTVHGDDTKKEIDAEIADLKARCEEEIRVYIEQGLAPKAVKV